MATFRLRSRMPVTADELFAWHARPGAFERLAPPWDDVEVIQKPDSIEDGARAVLRVPIGPFRVRWVAEHREYRPGVGFDDIQAEGPFAAWHHRHRMHPAEDGASELEDHVEYRLPLGFLGRWLGGRGARRQLDRMFAYRHAVTAGDLGVHGERPTPLRVAVTGSGGFLGGTLAPFLATAGHTVRPVRRASSTTPDTGNVLWDPATGAVTSGALEGVDAVVHLAGENIASGRWDEAKKRRIYTSRVEATRLLASTLAGLKEPPRVLVCASAVGWYGDRGDEALTEDSTSGRGFLADVCRAWEQATQPARDAGIRVVNLRLGTILDPRGGALDKLLTPFRLGAGGRLGSGRQWMSWVAMDDVLGAIHHAITNENLAGPVNYVAPAPVRNAEFARTLGRVLHRPAFLPAPAFALRALVGEAADPLLFWSTRVLPARLESVGYRFRHATLEGALRHMLGRKEAA